MAQLKDTTVTGGLSVTNDIYSNNAFVTNSSNALTPVARQENIAIIQTGNVATQNIAKGRWVLWNGVLHYALYAISTGETLNTSKLNPNSDGIANQLIHQSTTVSNGGLTFYLYRIGQLVHFWCPSASLTSGFAANATIVTFPEGYRPINQMLFPGASGGWASSNQVLFGISSDGTFYAKTALTNGRGTCVGGSFMVGSI